MKTIQLLAVAAFTGWALTACVGKQQPADATILGHSDTRVLQHPDWSKNATIYEVNIRQHTPEGTFNAFSKDIPRLKSMGVDILWLMPIHPIGEVNRKGGLGSHYSVKDYKAVNPSYGSLADFKNMVKTAHDNGMKVMIPTSNVKAVGMREIISSNEAEEVFKILRKKEKVVESTTWNRRYREYMEKIKTGSVFEVAKVLRDLYLLKGDKDLSFGERKMLDTARSLLVKEISIAKQMSEDEVETEFRTIFKC
jgi:CarD family transcriptional regulator